jgi:hypothetical protein
MLCLYHSLQWEETLRKPAITDLFIFFHPFVKQTYVVLKKPTNQFIGDSIIAEGIVYFKIALLSCISA